MARRSFADTMRDVKQGETIEEMDSKLQQLVQAVQRTGKGGSMTITIDVKPMKDSTEALIVKSNVKLKEPTFTDAGTVMFPTPEGNLQRSHHRQQELPGVALAASNG